MNHDLSVTLQVGKFGVSESQVLELIKQLKARKVVKIKILKSALGSGTRKELVESLAQRSDAFVASLVGNIAVLKRRSKDED